MGSGEGANRAKGISFKTLGLIFGSAVLGSAATLLFLRVAEGRVETFSTASLLGFVFMLVLTTVAIVLSLTAISLSRSTERALLGKGAVAVSPSRLPEAKPETVARERPATPVKSCSSPAPAPALLSTEARERAEKKYSQFKDIVLLGAANYPGVVSRKIGEGRYLTEGDELVDGSFEMKSDRVAVCTFCTGEEIGVRFMGPRGDRFPGFLRSLANELKTGHFTRVFLVFDRTLDSASPYAKALADLGKRIDADTFEKFERFEGPPNIIIPELTERVSQLMSAPPA